MIDIRSFSLLVRKDIILNFMDDTTKYKDESKTLEALQFIPCSGNSTSRGEKANIGKA
jgi:hypothetical protein